MWNGPATGRKSVSFGDVYAYAYEECNAYAYAAC